MKARLGAQCLVVVVLGGGPATVRADAVDDAYAAGNQAAAVQDWDAAVAHYQRATQLLPQLNSTLAYNLGTVHGQAGDLGRSTYWLRRSLDTRGGPTSQVVDLAHANLAEVRRRAELAAIASNAQIDRPANWWDVLLDALRAPWVGWASLIAGLGLLIVWGLERRRPGRRGALQAVLVGFGLAYFALGLLHGLALRADSVAPAAIVLGDRVDVRSRPGRHADSAFTIQGGARVRIFDHSPGWQQVRLPGGLAGWVPEDVLGDLSSGRVRAGEVASPQPDTKKTESD